MFIPTINKNISLFVGKKDRKKSFARSLSKTEFYAKNIGIIITYKPINNTFEYGFILLKLFQNLLIQNYIYCTSRCPPP